MAADPRSKNHAVHRSRSCPTSGSSCGRSLTDQHIETPKHQRFTSERRLHAARNEDSAAGRRPRDIGDVARNLYHPTPPAIAAQILRATESSLDRRPYHSNPAKMYELPASSFHRTSTDNDRACKKKYVLLVCSALMTSGAPTHRLEHYMQSSAVAVGIGLDSFYIPGCMVLSFSASPNQPSEVHIVRRVEALNLSKLHEVHSIYKAVIHGRITTGKAICQLDDISSSRTNRYPLWLQVILYGLTSACFGPISCGARPVDIPVIFLFGTLVGFLQLVLAPKSELYGYVFEMTAAILVSCLGSAVLVGTLTQGSAFPPSRKHLLSCCFPILQLHVVLWNSNRKTSSPGQFGWSMESSTHCSWHSALRLARLFMELWIILRRRLELATNNYLSGGRSCSFPSSLYVLCF